MPKKKWERPKLIVLVRGRQEEAVLQNCKSGSDPAWSGIATGCRAVDPVGGLCGSQCSGTMSS